MRYKENRTIAKYTNLAVEMPTHSFVEFAYISIHFKLYEMFFPNICDQYGARSAKKMGLTSNLLPKCFILITPKHQSNDELPSSRVTFNIP